MTSISVRAKLIFKLRKSLTKTTGGKPPRTLQDYPNWGEISTLVRLCHIAGYQTQRPNHNMLYVPEILHLVTLTSGVGPPLVRKSVYGSVINLLQAMYINRTEDAPASDFLGLLGDLETPESQRLFGLERLTQSSEYINYNVKGDKNKVDAQEKLTMLLARILEVTAGSRGLLNVWRARWMGLATSSAFQYSPAVQMRSFTTLGTLLTQEADDDYLYQMLVALRTALQQANETDAAIVVTMLRSLAKVVPALPDTSRYFVSLFWLAVTLLESSHVVFYTEASLLLSVTLESMRTRGMFRHSSVASVLLEGRDPLESVLHQFEQVLSISFDTNFSFALASVLFKGMRASIVKAEAEAVLRSLLGVTMRPYVREGEMMNGIGSRDVLGAEALGYFIALLPVSSTPASYRRLLKECGIGDAAMPETSGIDDEADAPRVQVGLLGIDGAATALLAASFIGAVVTSAQGNDAETEMLYCLLSDIGEVYPEIVAMTYDGLQEKIHEVFSKASNPTIIRAVSNIYRMAQEHDRPRFSASTLPGAGRPGVGGSTSTLSTVEEATQFTPGRNHLQALEDIGMAGVASNFVFLPLGGGHATKVIQWIPELVNLMVQ
ncbi:Ras-GAP domain-containing protein [Mycena venus]|uniref:Ras-GAP domain-containing protein n=1 Tax=Mycena venus TaxID=2733690 RepID=A0A8H6Y2Q7_9AGAR|nr:Ras-GAP domain-containing protein [Mycena venus]